MSVTITYKGETLETLNGGEYVTLHTNGKALEDDIRVEVAEVSGGDIAINGIVEQYKVNAGATVNAGDFVEFVTELGKGTFSDSAMPANGGFSACKLDGNRVFVAYTDKGNNNYGTAVVLTIGNNGITMGDAIVFNSEYPYEISTVALTDSKVLVVYKINSDGKGKATVLAVEGTTIEVGTTTIFSGDDTAGYITATALTDSKVLVAFRASAASLKAVVLTVSSTTITVGTAETICDSSVAISIVTLTPEKALIVGGLNSNIRAVVLTVSSTTITVGEITYLHTDQTYDISAVALTHNKVFVVFQGYYPSYIGKATVLAVEGTTITSGGILTFDSTVSGLSATALTDSKVLVACRSGDNAKGGRVLLFKLSGSVSANIARSMIIDTAPVENTSIVTLSEYSAVVVYDNGKGVFCGLDISGDNINATTEGGTYVQPATSRLHNVGVAKTSGTEGQTVDVYCV